MKTKIITILAALMLLPVSQVQAIDIDFYSDATIENGDVYNIVRIYDTPPYNTTVDMFGGSVESLRTYDSSTANIYGGVVLAEIRTANLSTVNINGGNVTLDVLAVGDSSIINVYGGGLYVGNSPGFSESSTVNIYGYGFNYGSNRLTGFLSDGSAFLFNELPFSQYSRMNLVEVAEPLVAEIDIKPTILNLASKGKWITCYICLPEDYNVADIDPNSVFLEYEIQAESIQVDEQEQVAIVRFSRSEVQGILNVGEAELTITGQLTDRTIFEGPDVIRVIDKGKKK